MSSKVQSAPGAEPAVTAPVWLGLSRNVLVLGLVSLLSDLAAEMIVPVLPGFLTKTLSAKPLHIGVIAGVAESLSSFLRLWSGWISDRVRKRKFFIVLGYGAASLLRPLVAFATSWWHVLLVRVADRTGKGLRIAPRDALFADSCDPAVRGRAFGYQQMADNLGAALGPLATLALFALATDLRAIFLLSAVPGVLVLLVAGAGVVEKPPARSSEPVRLTMAPFDRRFRLYLVATLLFHLAVASDFFLLLRMEGAGLTLPHILLAWSGFMAVRSAGAMLGGWLSDRLGRKPIILLGWTLFFAAWTAFPFLPSGWVLVPLGLFGLFGGFAQGPQRAFVADLIPERLRGTGYGLYACVLGVATLGANLGFGWISGMASTQAAFLTGSALALVGTALLLAVGTRSPVRLKT